MNRENDENYVIGYMCRVDWDCELGGAMGGNTIYCDIKDLKEHRKCWKSCGIVEVKVYFSKLVEQGTDIS